MTRMMFKLGCLPIKMLSSRFVRFVTVGIVNTAIHWCVFFIVFSLFSSQAVSNVVGFLCAVTFSFFANARFTFQGRVSLPKYLVYVAGMGAISFVIGWYGDRAQNWPIVTLVLSSATGLCLGYFVARFVLLEKGQS